MFVHEILAVADPLDHVKDGVHFGPTFFSAVGLTKHAFMFLVAGALTVLFFWSYGRASGRGGVPGRWGSFVEMVLEFLREQMIRPFLGEVGDRFLPLIATFFVYILFANLLGLVPFFDFLGHGGNTATGNIFVTAGLAVCSFVIYHTIGIREQGGIFVYVKNLFPHVPIFILPVMVLIELVAHLIRPCALAIRLFANMLAGHTMIAVIMSFTVAPAKLLSAGGVVSVACLLGVTALTFLELLVAVIQAFVFTFLTTVFLSMAVHPEH